MRWINKLFSLTTKRSRFNYCRWKTRGASAPIFYGLNDPIFGTVKSHIIQEEPLPKIKTVFARICKEEWIVTKLVWAVVIEEQTGATINVVFAVVAKPSSTVAMVTTPTSQKSLYSHCRKPGHEMANCYQLIGFSDRWERNKTNADGESSLECGRGRSGQGRSWSNYPHAVRGPSRGQGGAHSGWANAAIDSKEN